MHNNNNVSEYYDDLLHLIRYRYGIIVSALRMFTAESSTYYRALMECHKHEPAKRVYGLASMALVTAAAEVRKTDGIPIVALDIAGAEMGCVVRGVAFLRCLRVLIHTRQTTDDA